MAMSRKNYVDAAHRVRVAPVDDHTRRILAREFADFFAADNGRFQRDKFYAACGVGADYRHVKDYRGNPRPRRIGKFDDTVSAIIYEFDTDADLSVPDGGGWWGLYLNVTRDELEDFDRHSTEDLEPDELDSYRFPMHVILHERSDGIVQMTEYDTKRDAEEAWEELEAELSDEEE